MATAAAVPSTGRKRTKAGSRVPGPAPGKATPVSWTSRQALQFIREQVGLRWAHRTLLHHAEHGHIPSLRIGSRWLFWEPELRQHFRVPD
jgi:hypothetical protein